MAEAEGQMHVLILDDDEYIYWIASFEDAGDAKAAAKLANDNMRGPDSWHSFRVAPYPFYPKGTTLDLPTIKGLADDQHSCDDLWKSTDEERMEDVVYDDIAMAMLKHDRLRHLSQHEFDQLPIDRRLAIWDWVEAGAIAGEEPVELRVATVAPGQQELLP